MLQNIIIINKISDYNRIKLLIGWWIFLFILFSSLSLLAQGLIIDHNAVEQFYQIPEEWIISAKNNIKLHYQHTSHGSQPMRGAERIETELYKIAREEEALHNVTGALNIYEDIYPMESGYWTDDPPNIPALNKYPSINISMWSWCTALNRKPQSQMVNYFNGMEALEAKYPAVQFIYITCNAQAWHGHHTYNSDSEGYNRYLNNEIIRQYCREHNKVLYDFGDIDCWYDGEQATSEYNGNIFPREHDQYNVNEGGHTSYENCENKAKAFWYMMARIAGWVPDTSSVDTLPSKLQTFKECVVKSYYLQNYPNPFNPVTTIKYSLPTSRFVTLKVYNLLGGEVVTLVHSFEIAGNHSVNFDASKLSSGVYLYELRAGNYCDLKKMLFIK